MTDALIRKASPKDAPAIAACVDRAYGKYVERIGRKPKPMLADYRAAVEKHLISVIDGEDGLRAVLELVPGEDHLLIENIAVDPSCQKQGLGRLLMDFAEAEALRLRLPEMRLYANEQFTENIAFYTSLSYEETRRAPSSLGGTIVYMRKSIGG